MVNMLRSWAPIELGAVRETEDGGLEIEHPVILRGSIVKGRDKWTVTDAHAAEFARNFNALARKPPIYLGHPQAGETKPAIGWVKALRVADGAIHAVLSFGKEFADRLRKREFAYLSPGYALAAQDERGNAIGAYLDHVAILNDPHQTSLAPLLALGAYTPTPIVGAGGAEESDPMDINEIKNLVAAEIAPVLARLDAAETTVKAQTEELKTLAAVRDENKALAAQVTEANAKATAVQEGQAIREAREAITDAINLGKIAPGDLPDHDKDPVKALASAGYAGLPGFLKVMAATKPGAKVDLSGRKGVDGESTRDGNDLQPDNAMWAAIERATGKTLSADERKAMLTA